MHNHCGLRLRCPEWLAQTPGIPAERFQEPGWMTFRDVGLTTVVKMPGKVATDSQRLCGALSWR